MNQEGIAAMLPAHLAENIRKQVLYYLQSAFDFSSRMSIGIAI